MVLFGCLKAIWRLSEAEATGYAATSVSPAVSLAAAGSSFTCGIRSPDALSPDTTVVVEAVEPRGATVVVERRVGLPCFAQVKEEPAPARVTAGDMEQNRAGRPGARAQTVE